VNYQKLIKCCYSFTFNTILTLYHSIYSASNNFVCNNASNPARDLWMVSIYSDLFMFVEKDQCERYLVCLSKTQCYWKQI